MDLIGASLLLPVAVPFVAVFATLVAVDGGTPFYAHERVGRGGRSFRCWKIRTMRPGADSQLGDVLRMHPGARREWERDRKLSTDPRVTRLGAILRRWSIDELPQIWNVLRGEMSLVGPRPVTREELPRYGRSIGHYCSGRPGLTGAWQVNRSADTTYEERVEMDREYVETRSLWGDILILMMTLGTIFAPTGR
jgi:exopolysaccharide production protein ExoY